MLKEFKEFISRGSVLDLAVGVIIGGAFSAIVTSLVDNVFMPVIGMIIGGLDFTSLAIQVGDSKLMYGAFIQSVIDFLLVALCLFLFIKAINKVKNILHTYIPKLRKLIKNADKYYKFFDFEIYSPIATREILFNFLMECG